MDSLLSGAKGSRVCQKIELVELYLTPSTRAAGSVCGRTLSRKNPIWVLTYPTWDFHGTLPSVNNNTREKDELYYGGNVASKETCVANDGDIGQEKKHEIVSPSMRHSRRNLFSLFNNEEAAEFRKSLIKGPVWLRLVVTCIGIITNILRHGILLGIYQIKHNKNWNAGIEWDPNCVPILQHLSSFVGMN